MSDGKINVVVVDDHMITRSFFETTVKTSDKYNLVASFPSAEEDAENLKTSTVDLVVMDILMRKGIDGLTAAGIIKNRHPEIKIILATSTAEAKWLDMAREIGVESFWYKEYAEMSLLEVMDKTMEGERIYIDETTDITLGNITKGELTDRELEVLRELVTCSTNEQIAERLNISVATVKTHIRHMLEKTGFSDRLELAINASKSNIVVNDRELSHF